MTPLNIAEITSDKTSLELSGPAGRLECLLERPEITPKPFVAVVCHPHPLHGGTMKNKVVSTICRSLHKLGVWTLRFNYRGVGNSEGSYGDVTGECQDMLAVVDWTQQTFVDHSLWLAGFSFGAYVAAWGATQKPVKRLISIAPSVENMDYDNLPQITCPWLVVQGDQDEIVSSEAVFRWAEKVEPPVELIKMAGVGHFFHGKLIDLRETLMTALEGDLS